MSFVKSGFVIRVSYRILSWGGGGGGGGGGGEQDGSRMIVACSRMHKRACLLGGGGGVWGHAPPPWENFEFRSYQIASDQIWDKIIV